MKAGLRKSGFGFLFQGYTDDPDARGAWESEAGERAPLLDNRQADNLESLSDEGRQGPSAGSIVDPSIDWEAYTKVDLDRAFQRYWWYPSNSIIIRRDFVVQNLNIWAEKHP